MSPGDKVNVLLVDDQPAKLLAYEVILQELGENLIKASSGQEALEHLLRSALQVLPDGGRIVLRAQQGRRAKR